MVNHTGKKRKNCRKLFQFLASKCNQIHKKKTNTSSSEEFIKKYSLSKTNDIKIRDVKSLDLRRKIFVSLLSLYQSWKEYPLYMLYSAIFILPLKRDWIYNPSKYTQELESHIILKISGGLETEQFIELLKWKDSQGLLFWMLDEYKSTGNNNSDLIQPFWYHLSDKLSNLYDPVTGNKYKPIELDVKWWENKKYVSKYDAKTSSILTEFYFLTMKFKSIQEILYQSNPQSLHPIKCYQNNECANYKLYTFDEKKEELVLSNEGSDNDSWWISEEYDPYDLD